MQLKQTDLRKLQDVCLELVIELDRICRKNGIEYSLAGGSLIGAVREHGFIPWDDDADIAMTREEYEKFAEACERDLDRERFFLQNHHTDPAYPWGYSKLRRNDSKLVKEGQENMHFHNGIFIDIFIYDHVPDGYLARRLHYIKCFLIRKCQYAAVGKTEANSGLLRAVYAVMDRVPKEKVFAALERLAKKYNARDTELCRHLTFPYPSLDCKYGLPTSVFDGYKDASFEGRSLRIVRNYDTVLTLKYGDYMTPPPAKDIVYYPIEAIRFPGDEADTVY